MEETIHKARFILAEPNLILQNAAVLVSDTGCISDIKLQSDLNPVKNANEADWGCSLIIPGLVNAHTHLELTFLKNRLTNFTSFTDWISQLIDSRNGWDSNERSASRREGIDLSLASGTTLAGDIASAPFGDNFAKNPLRTLLFQEVLALAPDRAESALSALNWETANGNGILSTRGISPHAPYSVSPQLYKRAAELARRRQMPLTTHAAETLEEIQFLKEGTGEFKVFLDDRNLLPPGWTPPGIAPIHYLDSLGVLGRYCLLAHCNYLDEQSMAKIANSGTHVVYCPRSHHFFGHEKHPVRRLLDAGINVALGTDSLASNDSLSMIDEMRFLCQIRKDISAEEIFQAATLNGAKALGFDGVLGRLRKGYWADMTVVKFPGNIEIKNLLNQVLEGAGDCIATIIQGHMAWHKGLAMGQ